MQRLSLCLRPASARVTLGSGLRSSLRTSRRFGSGDSGASGAAGKKSHPTQKVDKTDQSWNNQNRNKITAVVLALCATFYLLSETGVIPAGSLTGTAEPTVDRHEAEAKYLAKALGKDGKTAAAAEKALRESK